MEMERVLKSLPSEQQEQIAKRTKELTVELFEAKAARIERLEKALVSTMHKLEASALEIREALVE